jgi:hypothetical protein
VGLTEEDLEFKHHSLNMDDMLRSMKSAVTEADSRLAGSETAPQSTLFAVGVDDCEGSDVVPQVALGVAPVSPIASAPDSSPDLSRPGGGVSRNHRGGRRNRVSGRRGSSWAGSGGSRNRSRSRSSSSSGGGGGGSGSEEASFTLDSLTASRPGYRSLDIEPMARGTGREPPSQRRTQQGSGRPAATYRRTLRSRQAVADQPHVHMGRELREFSPIKPTGYGNTSKLHGVGGASSEVEHNTRLAVELIDYCEARRRSIVEGSEDTWTESWGTDPSMMEHRRDTEGEQLVQNLAHHLRGTEGPLFVDAYLAADNGAISPGLLDKVGTMQIRWLRPVDFAPVGAVPVVYGTSLDWRRIEEGPLGSCCYLLVGLQFCASSGNTWLLDDLIVSDGADVGLYGVKLYVHGKWVTVLIDDLFPCTYSSPSV